MRCDEIRKQFSAYIDGEALPEIAAAIEAHVAECADCRAELERCRSFAQAFSQLGQEELPFGFEAELRARLAEEKVKKPRKAPKRAWLGVAAVAACLLLAVGLGSAGLFRMGSSAPMSATMDAAPMETMTADKNYYEDYAAAETPAMEMPAAAEDGSFAAITGAANGGSDASVSDKGEAASRKIIKDFYLSLEVADYQTAYQSIAAMAEEYGGYVVSGETYNYSWSTGGRISIRVDSAQADTVAARIAQLGEVSDQNVTTDDVTAEYYDTASRLKVYEAQRDRLLQLYEKAETVEDMITIEQALTQVIAEIEALQGTLQYLEQLTSLSLIQVSLTTPQVETVELGGWAGFWQDLQNSLIRGLNNVVDFLSGFVLLLVRILPFLLIIAVVVFIIVASRRRRKKKQNRA